MMRSFSDTHSSSPCGTKRRDDDYKARTGGAAYPAPQPLTLNAVLSSITSVLARNTENCTEF